MWSGQTISPSEPLGREVIKIFVESSHHSNILAWPKAQGGPLGASRSFSGSVQPLRNMRATRGGHTGQHGRDSGRAIDRDWRANENNPRTAGRIIGEIDVNQPASIATRRNAMQLTVNSAPLPQTDGAFESARTPRPGQIVSCVVDENGALVPVTPEYPQTANPMKHMTDHQYFSRFGEQTLSVEDLRGNSFGDLRGGRRGGLRGGRSPIIIQHNYFGTDKQVGLGINNHQGELHHAESSATIKSQHPGEPSTSSGSSLKHAAFAAEFVPMSDANRSLKQTGTGKKVEFELYVIITSTTLHPAQASCPSINTTRPTSSAPKWAAKTLTQATSVLPTRWPATYVLCPGSKLGACRMLSQLQGCR